MEKITKSSDKVLIDPNEPLILPDGTALVGRVEWFLYALCCLDYQNLPTPMSRIEEFANALITGEVPNIEPQSRAEQFFLAILDGNISDLPQPQSRSEVLLDKLARGEFDLSDVEPIQSRYELLLAYLIKNGGIGNIDYVLYEFSEAMKTMYNTVEKPFKSLELSGNTLVNCVLEDTENDDYTSFDKDYSGTSFTINGTNEGAIKSAILKGQTLVNLATQKSGSFNGTRFLEIPLSRALKANTKYFVNFNVKESTLTQGVTCRLKYSGNTSFVGSLNSSGIITTNALEFDSIQFYIKNANDVANGLDAIVDDIMLIEYQEGMENWDIPYFEGMQSVKMPVLTTTGKNLFDGIIELGGINSNTGLDTTWSGSFRTSFMRVPKNNTNFLFTFNCKGLQMSGGYLVIIYYNENKERISSYSVANQQPFNFNQDAYYYRITQNVDDTLNISDITNIQLEKGTIATAYEPHKSNILTVNEEVELRGIGEVKDELNVATGELTQRVGEDIFDGSSDEVITIFDDTFTNNIWYKLILTKDVNGIDTIICDKFKTNITWGDYEQIQTHNKSKNLFVGINRSRLTEENVDGFKQWLSQNPITVQYPLVTESIKTVDLNVVDQNNTKIDKIHVFNEVTHVNTSSDELTPTVNIGKSVSYPTIIKPNTKYTVDLKRNDKPLTVNLGGTEVTFATGETRKVITTPSTLTNDKLSCYGIGAKCNEIMLIEGEVEGNVDYFTGMQSVVMQNQMPILSTTGKNLFNVTNVECNDNSFTIINLNNSNYFETKTLVEEGKQYTLSLNVNISGNIGNILALGYMNYSNIVGGVEKASHNIVTIDSEINKFLTLTFVAQKTDYVKIYIATGKSGYLATLSNVQLEEGSIATPYEPYKTSILSLSEEIVVRSLLNGVCDTLNVLTGEYTQRIGEIEWNGSSNENWSKITDGNNWTNGMENITTFSFPKPSNCILTWSREGNEFAYLSNKFPSVQSVDRYAKEDKEKLMFDTFDIKMGVLKTKLDTQDVDGLRLWLSQNPITVQYELTEPIITTIDLNVVDQDGNTIPKTKSYNSVTHLEVTVPKQSLLPNISAEVATDNSKDMSSLTIKHQEISEAQSAIQDNIQSQSDEIDTALMATTEIFESILE